MENLIVNPGNFSAIHSILKNFYSEGKHCDVNIQVENKSFICHRVLLSAVSEYFDVMFSGNWLRNICSLDEPIVLHDMNAAAFEEVLKFTYTGTLDVDITDANVHHLFRTSDFLMLRSNFIELQCVKYIRNRIMGNDPFGIALDIYAAVRGTGRNDLILSLSEHISKHLSYFCMDIAFMEISWDDLNSILKFKYSSSDNETLLITLLQWVHHSREERKGHLDKLLRNIDFSKISALQLMNLMTNEYADLIGHIASNAIRENVSREGDGDNVEKLTEKFLHVFVNFSNGRPVGVFSTKEMDWLESSKNFTASFGDSRCFRSFALDSNLYCLSNEAFNVTNSIRARSNLNLEIPPFFFGEDFELCGMLNYIYLYSAKGFNTIKYQCIDSFNFTDVSGHVGVYNCYLDKWFPVPSMKQEVRDAHIAIDKNLLYVIGKGASSNKYAQAYDYRTKKWYKLPNTLNSVQLFNFTDCCAHQGKIYVADLHHNSGHVEMEVYDPVAGKWMLNRMPEWYVGCGIRLLSFSDNLWVISTDDGGLNVLKYEPTSQKAFMSALLKEAVMDVLDNEHFYARVLDAVVF